MNIQANSIQVNDYSDAFSDKIESARAVLVKIGLTPAVLEEAKRNGQAADQVFRKIVAENAAKNGSSISAPPIEPNPDLDAIISEWMYFSERTEVLQKENAALKKEIARLKSRLQSLESKTHLKAPQLA